MEISFVLDWTSFWIGVAASWVLGFVSMVAVAAVQYKKQKRKSSVGGRRL